VDVQKADEHDQQIAWYMGQPIPIGLENITAQYLNSDVEAGAQGGKQGHGKLAGIKRWLSGVKPPGKKLVKKPLSTRPKPPLGARAKRMSLFSSSARTLIPDSASSLEYCTPASSTASSDLSRPSKTYHVVNDGQILAHSRPEWLVPYDLRLRSEQLLKQMSLHIHHIEGFPEDIVGSFPMNSGGIAGRRACLR